MEMLLYSDQNAPPDKSSNTQLSHFIRNIKELLQQMTETETAQLPKGTETGVFYPEHISHYNVHEMMTRYLSRGEKANQKPP